MGRGSLGRSQGMPQAVAAQAASVPAAAQPASAPNSQVDAIRESLRNSGRMDLAAFNGLNDADMAQVLAEIDQYESRAELRARHLADTDTQRFFNQIGWTEDTPQVLSDAAYERERVAIGAQSLYHTDAPYPGISTQKMLDQFRTGTQYLSAGIHGDGTYLAEQAGDSWGYGYGHATARQQKMFLNRNARIIDERKLWTKIHSWRRTHPNADNQIRRLSAGRIDGQLSVYAAMFGYNVIKDGDYYSVLNRKALTVAKSHKQYSRTSNTSNW